MHDRYTVTFDYDGGGSMTGIVGANYTMARGVLPSVGSITIAPQNILSPTGTLTFQYIPAVGSSTTIALPDCWIDTASIENVGPQVRQIKFFDRRWRWNNGHIDGLYNIRIGTNEFDREQTTAQLMTLCLDAMGESGYDVSLVTDTARLSVDWRADVPSLALQEVMSALGYVLAIRPDNTAKIYPIGTGTALPSTGVVLTTSYSATRGILPEKVRVACSNVRYQTKFRLEAVGVDTDGEVKLIDDLSYKPTDGGWEQWHHPGYDAVLGTHMVDGKAVDNRELAKRSVFKWYRIGKPAHSDLFWAPPGYQGTPEDIDKREYIIPLRNHLNEDTTDPDGKKRPKKSMVTGSWYTMNDRFNDPANVGVYDRSFSLDSQRGIVIFSDYVFLQDADQKHIEAAIYLTCVVEVEDLPTGKKQYYAYTKPTGASGASGIQGTDHPEIILKYTPTYTENVNLDTVTDNQTDVDTQAEFYADAMIATLAPESAATVEYGELLALELDGLRRNVQWRAGYGQPLKTVASIGVEINPYQPSYEQDAAQELRRLEEKRARRTKKFTFEGDPSPTDRVD